ncbi:hypothetical protein NSU_0555 [Novosphingobium pentaromativorans US6-1]|uniref:Uncharacterized protein n=1 Tax=Novosphingobium pentaromativorans US6-1 TaxID=1088721 RepID=G6E883_9SPHN|nr:hypothetical protein NSU_0555 [Novosphingobium pentaromativorans US6-1]
MDVACPLRFRRSIPESPPYRPPSPGDYVRLRPCSGLFRSGHDLHAENTSRVKI